MRSDVDPGHLGVEHLDPRFVEFVDEIALHDETGFGFGGADEFEDFFDAGERFSRPVVTNLAEKAMFDGIPLGGAGWVVADSDSDTERVSKSPRSAAHEDSSTNKPPT